MGHLFLSLTCADNGKICTSTGLNPETVRMTDKIDCEFGTAYTEWKDSIKDLTPLTHVI